MKKLIGLILFILALSCHVAHAETSLSELLDKMPPLKQGIGWSIVDSKLNYLSTVEVAKWKAISLEAGYAGSAENTGDKVIAVISTSLLNAKNMGVEIPILDLLDVNLGLYAGYGSINGAAWGDSELDYGVSATLLTVKW